MVVNRGGANTGATALRLWQDRGVVVTGILLLGASAMAWIEVVRQAGEMQPMAGPSMGMSSLTLGAAVVYLISWGIMMAAMMLPSALPMIAVYAGLHRNTAKTASSNRGVSTFLFAAVYLVVWMAVGIPVYLASVGIDAAARSSSNVADALPYAVAVTLLAAGVFQFTPWQSACLRACQHPFMFLLGHWRQGYAGTLRMAFDNAIYCLGCCAALMIVFVAAGAMALQWVLVMAVVVFAEKLLPRGEWTARSVGAAFIILGLIVAVHPALAGVLRGGTM